MALQMAQELNEQRSKKGLCKLPLVFQINQIIKNNEVDQLNSLMNTMDIKKTTHSENIDEVDQLNQSMNNIQI